MPVSVSHPAVADRLINPADRMLDARSTKAVLVLCDRDHSPERYRQSLRSLAGRTNHCPACGNLASPLALQRLRTAA